MNFDCYGKNTVVGYGCELARGLQDWELTIRHIMFLRMFFILETNH